MFRSWLPPNVMSALLGLLLQTLGELSGVSGGIRLDFEAEIDGVLQQKSADSLGPQGSLGSSTHLKIILFRFHSLIIPFSESLIHQPGPYPDSCVSLSKLCGIKLIYLSKQDLKTSSL